MGSRHDQVEGGGLRPAGLLDSIEADPGLADRGIGSRHGRLEIAEVEREPGQHATGRRRR